MLYYLFRLFQDPYEALSRAFWPLIRLVYRTQFAHFGDSVIIAPTRLSGTRLISIGDDTVIDHYCELNAAADGPTPDGPVLIIGNGCRINGFNRIGATKRVEIQDHVLMASNIFISDTDHGYMDTSVPILSQANECRGPVVIESGCWIGDGVKILGGVTIGRNSVIGANSVVTTSIPPFSVAAGAPARVIRNLKEAS